MSAGLTSTSAPSVRIELTTSSNGVFIFARRASPELNSGELKMARSVVLMSPPDLWKASATRATSAGSGLSETNLRHSFVAMNFAVEGCATSMSKTFRPSSTPPPAATRTPSTFFSPSSCMRGAK
jgi:hypothetical protein